MTMCEPNILIFQPTSDTPFLSTLIPLQPFITCGYDPLELH